MRRVALLAVLGLLLAAGPASAACRDYAAYTSNARGAFWHLAHWCWSGGRITVLNRSPLAAENGGYRITATNYTGNWITRFGSPYGAHRGTFRWSVYNSYTRTYTFPWIQVVVNGDGTVADVNKGG